MIRYLKIKVKSQAMQFALLISVLVAILLSAFLMLTHVQSFFRIQSQELIEITGIANKNIFEGLGETNSIKDTVTTQIGSTTTKLTIGYHGAWKKIISEAGVRERKIIKTAYTGSEVDVKTPNLYLVNKNSPLVVVGTTRLEGNSYLPKQGIKAGNISGNYYQGSSLYYGKAIESKESLPLIDAQWISYLRSVSKGDFMNEENVIPLETEIKNSFKKPSKIIFNTDVINVFNQNITGNIILQSKTKIVVHATSQLEDVLLIAPIIVIKNNVKGKMQLIASKKLQIGKGCYLSYPSSLILFDETKVQNTSQQSNTQNRDIDFNIDQNTVIEGSIAYLQSNNQVQDRIKTHLKIEDKVQVIGEIYCQGNMDFQGTVKGSLYTQQFIANQSGSLYLNHLYNGKVLLNPVPGYVGLSFSNSKNSVAKWLY